MKNENRFQPIKIMTIWQTLVVDSYRSFYYQAAEELAKKFNNQIELALVSPKQFIELGSQLRDCDPPKKPFDGNNSKRKFYILDTKSLHIQCVWYKKLRKVITNFFNVKTKSETRIILCMSEPYSLTSFFVWIIAKIYLRNNFKIYFYALQNIYKNFTFPLRLVQKLMFKVCEGILVLGDEHEQVLRKHGYTGKTIYFPLWFNSNIFFRQSQEDSLRNLFKDPLREASILKNKIVIGFSGSLKEEKGIYDLLNCIEMNLDQWKEKCVLMISGGGAEVESIKNECKKIEDKGFPIIFLGPISSKKMSCFLSQCDILVVPSRTMVNWKEQFGRIIIEAKACGCIVIGSDSGEIPKIINDKNYIFPEGNLNAMSNVVDMAIKNIPTDRLKKDFYDQSYLEVFNKYSDVVLAQKFFNQMVDQLKSDHV